MAFSPISIVLGSALAEREGVADPQARARLALLGGLLGYHSPVTGLMLTAVLARREAEAASAPVASAPVLSLVQIPNVEGQNITEARRKLEAFGLNVLSDAQSDTIPKESVVSQDPAAFSLVLEGATVTLAVSRGFELPDVTNEPVADAETLLNDLGLQVRRRSSQYSNTIPKGSVIAQDPKAGALVSKGDTVTLTASKGRRKATLVDLPNLVGQPFRDAREELQDLDLRVKHISVDSGRAPNEVVDQDPKPGKIEAGRQVTLSLSNGSGF